MREMEPTDCPQLDMDSACVLVREECVTASKAAALCGLGYHEFADELKSRGIRWKS